MSKWKNRAADTTSFFVHLKLLARGNSELAWRLIWSRDKAVHRLVNHHQQNGKCTQAQLKSPSQTIYHIHRSLSRKLSSKKSLLLTCQFLGLLVNTLATDKKYFAHHDNNLKISIQSFAAFLKSRWKFIHFQWEDEPHRFCIFEVTDSENVVR